MYATLFNSRSPGFKHSYKKEHATSQAAYDFQPIIALRGRRSVVIGMESAVDEYPYNPRLPKRMFTVESRIGVTVAGSLDQTPLYNAASEKIVNSFNAINRGTSMPLQMYAHCMRSYLSDIKQADTSFYIMCAYDCYLGPQMVKYHDGGPIVSYTAIGTGRAGQPVKDLVRTTNILDLSTKSLVQEIGKLIYSLHDFSRSYNFKVNIGVVGFETNGIFVINKRNWIRQAELAGQQIFSTWDTD